MTRNTLLGVLLALTASPALAGDETTYAVDGIDFAAYVATSDTPKGTILLLPTWNGLSDYEKDRAQMLAEMGYTTIAADLYPIGQRPTTMDAKQAALKAHLGNQAGMHAILTSAISTARETRDDVQRH